MRTLKIIAFIFCVTSQIAFAQTRSDVINPEEREQLTKGLENNDILAFEEVSKLPVEDAAPLLLGYVEVRSAGAELARATLSAMPGFSGYMKQRLLNMRKQPAGELNIELECRKLKAIGGEAAAAAIAPFLFVDDEAVALSEDQSAGPIRYTSLNALAGMQLDDRPENRVSNGHARTDIDEWKAWAIKKGYRDSSIPPLMTLEEKDMPQEFINRSRDIIANAGNSGPPTLLQAAAPPSPSTSADANLKNETKSSDTRPLSSSSSVWAVNKVTSRVLTVLSLVFVIGAAVIFALLRKRN